MAPPSFRLVLILTSLQINNIYQAEGLTLPLQTVTKCESFTKSNPKPKTECILNDQLNNEGLNKPFPAQDNIGQPSTINPAVTLGPLNNAQEGQCNALPIPPQQAPFAANTGPEGLNLRQGIPGTESTCLGNLKLSALNSPMPVTSSATTLSPPSLQSPDVTNCNKPLNSVVLDDCVASSTITNPMFLPNQMPSPNPSLSNPSVCPNSYNPGPISCLASSNTNLGPNCKPETTLSVTPNNLPVQQILTTTNTVLGLPSASIGTNIATIGYNNYDKIGNNLPSPSCSCNLLPASQIAANLAQNCESNKLAALPNINNPPSPTVIPPPSGKNLTPKSDIGPLPVSSQPNIAQTSTQFTPNGCVPYYPSTQGQPLVDPSPAGLPLALKDAVIYPTVQTYPPPNLYPIAPQQILPEQNYLIPNEPSVSNACPMPLNQKTSISDYFKGAKAATAKLNDFISAFSSRISSQNIPTLQSFPNVFSQAPSQPNIVPIEDKLESALLSPFGKPSLPVATITNSVPLLQPSIIPFEESCPSKVPNISMTPSSKECATSVLPPVSSIAYNLPYPIYPLAPKVPATAVHAVNFPICSYPVQCNSLQDSLASISTSNYTPQPQLLTNIQAAFPSNPYANVGSCNNNLPNTPPISQLLPLSLPPVVKNPTLNTFALPKPIISSNEEGTSILIPDILSSILPKNCKSCKKAIPYISSIAINTDCEPACDCSVASSNVDSSSVDVPSSPTSNVSEPFLDESQLDVCCKNLENIIAMLELSLNLNGDVDCDLDSVPDILSTL